MANSSRPNKFPSPAQSSLYTLFPPAETKRSDDAGMDIPEGANLEASLKAGEELFRASVEALLDGFAIFTSIRDNHDRIIDFRYEYINDAGCRLNQRSREDLVGHTLLELFPAQKDLGLIEAYAQVVETGEPLIKENLVYEDVFGNGQRMTRVFDLRTGKLGDGFVSCGGTRPKKSASRNRSGSSVRWPKRCGIPPPY
jgi:PAS domain-containing protein